MNQFYFLDNVLGDNIVYEHILIALIEEKMTFSEIHEHLRDDRGHTYKERTIREKLRDLQDYNLVTKEHEGHKVQYKIPEWYYFRQNTLDPLREKTKRNIFDKVEY